MADHIQTYKWELDGTVHRESSQDKRRTVCGLWLTRYYSQKAPSVHITCKPCLEDRTYVSLQDAGIRPF